MEEKTRVVEGDIIFVRIEAGAEDYNGYYIMKLFKFHIDDGFDFYERGLIGVIIDTDNKRYSRDSSYTYEVKKETGYPGLKMAGKEENGTQYFLDEGSELIEILEPNILGRF